MFFDDVDLTLKRRATLRVPPPTPETGWRPPESFPNLSAASVISFDVETKETDWAHGPGWARGPKGHIVGFSLAAKDKLDNRGKWYFPVRHEVEPEYNLDPETCFNWLRYQLHTPLLPKIGANLVYDVGWLTEENIFVQGPLYDSQYAESLLDENARTALDMLAEKYLGENKETSLLYDWIDKAYNPKKTERRGEIWRCSPRLVGPYGEADADLPLRILEKQWPIMSRDGLLTVFELECKLIRLLVQMRRAGVRIDMEKAHRLYDDFGKKIEQLEYAFWNKWAHHIQVDSNADIATCFDKLGIKYPKTEAGNPSFVKEWLEGQEHPACQEIVQIRKYRKLRSTFIRGYLIEGSNNGRINCNFHPLRNDDGGAKTGRFSSEGPNLQNIPVRTEEGKLIRSAFVPDYGNECWEKNDYSQIEYRMLAHFAVGPGAEQLRHEYQNDPSTDYHDKVYFAACPVMGWDPTDKELMKVKRRPIKNTNFGLLYGQKEKSLAIKMGMTKEEASEFFKGYHRAAPWVEPTMAEIAAEVQRFGFITTILGRRVRFGLWEPAVQEYGERAMPLPYDAAIRAWGHAIRLAYDYRGVNYKFQGSAADFMKAAMVAVDEAGIFDVIGVPRLTVHDELDFSVIDNSPQQVEAYNEMRRVMENCIQLQVPVRVDSKRGQHWGEAD